VRYARTYPSCQSRHLPTLYAAAGAQGKPSDLLILNPDDGSVRCRVGPIGFGVTGLAVNPLTGVLYGTTGNADASAPGSLIQIDKTTGAGQVIVALPSPSPNMPVTFPDITFTSDGTLYGVLYNINVTNSIDLWSVNVRAPGRDLRRAVAISVSPLRPFFRPSPSVPTCPIDPARIGVPFLTTENSAELRDVPCRQGLRGPLEEVVAGSRRTS